MDIVTALTVALVVSIAIPIASFITRLLMVEAAAANNAAARWELFCGGNKCSSRQ